MRRTIIVAAFATLTSPAFAEDLNLKYGPSWDCFSITAGTPLSYACAKCDMATQDFDDSGGGHCIPKPGASNAPSGGNGGGNYGNYSHGPGNFGGSPTRKAWMGPPPRRTYWGAVAAAVWHDGSGQVHVAIGSYYNAPSEADADVNAVNECNQAGGQGCSVVSGKFSNGGCGYITTGHRRGGVTYVTGSNSSEVYYRCASTGYECKPPIGGCTKRPSS